MKYKLHHNHEDQKLDRSKTKKTTNFLTGEGLREEGRSASSSELKYPKLPIESFSLTLAII
jgi:hypothetical protein